jgi:hypothetical protein
MPVAVRKLPGLQYLAGILDEVVRRLACFRANDFNETSDIIRGSLGPKTTQLLKRLPADRAGSLKVALLGASAGQDGVALDASPQMGGSAELDRSDGELLSLSGAIEVAEAAREVTG